MQRRGIAVLLGQGKSEPAHVGELSPQIGRVAACVPLHLAHERSGTLLLEELARVMLELFLIVV